MNLLFFAWHAQKNPDHQQIWAEDIFTMFLTNVRYISLKLHAVQNY